MQLKGLDKSVTAGFLRGYQRVTSWLRQTLTAQQHSVELPSDWLVASYQPSQLTVALLRNQPVGAGNGCSLRLVAVATWSEVETDLTNHFTHLTDWLTAAGATSITLPCFLVISDQLASCKTLPLPLALPPEQLSAWLKLQLPAAVAGFSYALDIEQQQVTLFSLTKLAGALPLLLELNLQLLLTNQLLRYWQQQQSARPAMQLSGALQLVQRVDPLAQLAATQPELWEQLAASKELCQLLTRLINYC